MRTLESLLDASTKSADAGVITTLKDRGGLLDTTYNLYGEEKTGRIVFPVKLEGRTLRITPPPGRSGMWVWRYMTPGSSKLPPSPSKLLDIDDIWYDNKFVYAVGQHGSQSLDGKNFVKKLKANGIEIFAKDVSNIELESYEVSSGIKSIIWFKSLWPITLKNVVLNADIVSFNTDGDVPNIKAKGSVDHIRVYGTALLEDVADKYDKLMDKDHTCEFEYNGHRNIKHLSFKKVLQAFNNPLKYKFYQCPFWFNGLTLDDFINVSNLNPSLVTIYNNNVMIAFFKDDMECPIVDVNTHTFKIFGDTEPARQKFANNFPITKDGYRMVILKRK